MNKGRLIWFGICMILSLYGIVGIVYYSTINYFEPRQYTIDIDNDGNLETVSFSSYGLSRGYAYLTDINPHLFVFIMTLFFGWIWLIPNEKTTQHSFSNGVLK